MPNLTQICHRVTGSAHDRLTLLYYRIRPSDGFCIGNSSLKLLPNDPTLYLFRYSMSGNGFTLIGLRAEGASTMIVNLRYF